VREQDLRLVPDLFEYEDRASEVALPQEDVKVLRVARDAGEVLERNGTRASVSVRSVSS